jgi:hypothetical protein
MLAYCFKTLSNVITPIASLPEDAIQFEFAIRQVKNTKRY